MRLLEIRMFINYDETLTQSEDVRFRLEQEIDDTINGVVKRVDIIDEFEVA